MSDLSITTGPFCPDCATEHDAPESAAAADGTLSVPARSSTRHVGPSTLESMPMACVVVDVAAATHPDDAALANEVAKQVAAALPFELSQDAKSEIVAQAQQVLQTATDMGLGPLVRLDISAKANGIVYGVGIRGGVSLPVVSRDASSALQAGGNPRVSIGVSTPAPPGFAVGVSATFYADTGVSSGPIDGTATGIPVPGGGTLNYKTNGSSVTISTNVFSTGGGVPTAGLETSFEVPTVREIAEYLTGTTPQQQLWALNDMEALQHALNKRDDAAWSKRIDARYDEEICKSPDLADVINLEREREHNHRVYTLGQTSRHTIELFQAFRAPIQAQLPKLPAN
jgi:hypothetical protein